MARRAKKRRGGLSYEEVKSLIDKKEELKKLRNPSKKQRLEEEKRQKRLREEQRPTDDNQNRVRHILEGLVGNENPEDLMIEIMNSLSPSGFIPSPGKFYTFVYNAKTPKITYDQHPLIAAIGVSSNGFVGFNFHWVSRGNPIRNYTWNEVAGQIYEVDSGEIGDMREIPYAMYLNN